MDTLTTEVINPESIDDANNYEHVFEVHGEKEIHSLKSGRSKAPDIDEVAEILEIPEDKLSWVVTHDKADTIGKPAAAVPCVDCGGQVWTTKRHAEEVLEEEWRYFRCGGCVDEPEGEEGEN